ncbi:MAG: zinc-ribbon domain-containing protein [Methyloversatilis sp.]|nr:zinc-ribbon domain-containing protein [Methyloversatilis sp.]
MLSRCPACATVFRVDTVQIRAREGRVRCGRCHAVFDALDAMVDIAALRAAGPVATGSTPVDAPPSPASPPPFAANTVAEFSETPDTDIASFFADSPSGDGDHPPAPPEESHATLNVVDAPEARVSSEASAVTTDRLTEPAGLTEPPGQPMPEPGGSMDALVARTTDYWGMPSLSEPSSVTSPEPAAKQALDPDITQPLDIFELDAAAGLEFDPAREPATTDNPADASPAHTSAATDGLIPAADDPAEASVRPPADVVDDTAPASGTGDDTPDEVPAPAPARDPLLDPPPALEPVRDPAMQRIRRELYGDEEPAARSGLRTALWIAGCLLLALLATGQLAYHFRTELALAQPALKPVFEQACARMGCSVPAPREPDKVSIEASELTPEPGREPLLRLSALLRNTAAFEQEWPHLELTLTDTGDRAVVRRVLTPSEFLPPDARAKGFAPASEQTVGVLVDPAESGASGYRLYAFYP